MSDDDLVRQWKDLASSSSEDDDVRPRIESTGTPLRFCADLDAVMRNVDAVWAENRERLEAAEERAIERAQAREARKGI